MFAVTIYNQTRMKFAGNTSAIWDATFRVLEIKKKEEVRYVDKRVSILYTT